MASNGGNPIDLSTMRAITQAPPMESVVQGVGVGLMGVVSDRALMHVAKDFYLHDLAALEAAGGEEVARPELMLHSCHEAFQFFDEFQAALKAWSEQAKK